MSRKQRDGEELFSAAFDGQLAPAEQQAFEQRLAADGELRADYEQFQALMSQADLLFKDAPVPDLMPGIRAKLKKRKDPVRGDRMGQLGSRGRLHPLLLACVLGMLLLLLWLAFSAVEILQSDGGSTPTAPLPESPAAGNDR